MKITVSMFNSLSENEKSEVVNRIKHFRKNIMHHTQLQFARELDISQSNISMIEAGRKPLTCSVVEKVIESYNVNLDWLLFGSSNNVFGNESSYKYEANTFIEWFKSLPPKEQALTARAIMELSGVISSYPPGS